MEQSMWGSDVVPSLPVTLEEADGERVSLGGFCFTPLGIRVDMTETERDELLAQAFKPAGGMGHA